MNKDTIIDMAREARLWEVLDLFSGEFGNANTEEDCLPDLTRFAALVAAHEREECAKVCEEIEMQGHALWDRTADPDAQGRATGAMDCAAAIRSRNA